jgi:hypothetical protein
MKADAITTMSAYTGLGSVDVMNLYDSISKDMGNLVILEDLTAFEAAGMGSSGDLLGADEKLLGPSVTTPSLAVEALSRKLDDSKRPDEIKAADYLRALPTGLKSLLGYALMADEKRVNLINWEQFGSKTLDERKVIIYSLAMPLNAIGGQLSMQASAGLTISELTGLRDADAVMMVANIKVGVHELTKAELIKRAKAMMAHLKGFITTIDLINFAFHIYMNGNHDNIPDNWPIGRYTHGSLKSLKRAGAAFGKNTFGRILSGFLAKIHSARNVWSGRIPGFRNRLEASVEAVGLAEDPNYQFLIQQGVNYFNGQYEPGKDRRVGPAMNAVISMVTESRSGGVTDQKEGQPGAPARRRRGRNM